MSMNNLKFHILRLLIGLFTLHVTACIPTTQIQWHSSTEEIRIAPGSDRLGVSSKNMTGNLADTPRIDIGKSYATKDGQKYRLRTEINAYVEDQKSTHWGFEWVMLVKHNGKDTKQINWSNGRWELHLEYQKPLSRPIIDSKFTLSTFWYIPIVDGWPN